MISILSYELASLLIIDILQLIHGLQEGAMSLNGSSVGPDVGRAAFIVGINIENITHSDVGIALDDGAFAPSGVHDGHGALHVALSELLLGREPGA